MENVADLLSFVPSVPSVEDGDFDFALCHGSYPYCRC